MSAHVVIRLRVQLGPVTALLDKGHAIDIDSQEAVADRLVELARSLNSYLTT